MLLYRIAEAQGCQADDLDLYHYELKEWESYFEWQDHRRDKTDWYMSQLCGFMSGRDRWRMNDFFPPEPGKPHGKRMTAHELGAICKAWYGVNDVGS